MENFKQEAYNVFELFDRQWAIVTAGSIEHYNSCTVGWGSLGNLWGPTGRSRPAVTVYVHPARYTCEFLERGDTFTVSFYPPECRRALGYIGSHSGRDGDKTAAAGLTPVAFRAGRDVCGGKPDLPVQKSSTSTSSLQRILRRRCRHTTPRCRRSTPTFTAAGSRTSRSWAKSST